MRTSSWLVVTLSFLGASAAEAREIEVALGPGVVLAESASVDAVASEDGLGFASLEVAAEIGRFGFVDRLYAEAVVMGGGGSATDFEQFEGQIGMRYFQVGARAVKRIGQRVRAFARLDAGVMQASLRLAYDAGTATPIADGRTTWSAWLGAGAEGRIMTLGAVDFSLRVEGGWLVVPEVAFRAEPDHPDDDLARIDTVAAELGSVHLGGMGLRAAVVGRF